MDKTFTIAEANALLPQLKRELIALQAAAARFEEQRKNLQQAKERNGSTGSAVVQAVQGDPFFELEASMEFTRMEMNVSIQNFERAGVLLKMIHPGLIDFPAILDNQEILLCWKEGEERISHFHGLEDGFRGRRKLPDIG